MAAKVLFVNHTSRVSGAELVLLDLVAAVNAPSAFLFEDGNLRVNLARRGVHVIQSRFGRSFSDVKRDTSLVKALPLASRMSALTGELSIAARRYDVIYANSQKAFVLGAVASALVRRPLIWHLHDIISAEHFGAQQRRLQVGLANRFAAAVICPSKPVGAAFVAAGGHQALVRVVPNGLDLALAPPVSRRELDLPSGPLIGVFSRLAPWKGQHVVLRAVARHPNVGCIIVGDALFGEADYAASLRTLVSDLRLDDRVRFLGHRSDVPELMGAVDIVVHPSVAEEPFGRTLVEAMLVRTPVIATNTGAPAEILAEGAAGTLVAPGDTDALVAAIRTILARPASLAAQLDLAQARARELYGVSRMLHSVRDIIEEAANSRSAYR